MAMNGEAEVAVKVFGDYACFSRPEFKVERVSYPVITPSAARGVLEAIFWKPEIRYQIRQIHVLNLGSQLTILRNEVSLPEKVGPFLAAERRQPRTSLVLRNVGYVIRAEIVLRPHVRAAIGKYLDQFNRRAAKGQCHHTPCLGTREFTAHFERPTTDDRGAARNPQLELDLGQMLFDLAFVESEERPEIEFLKPTEHGHRKVKGFAQALFFHATIGQGVLNVPPERYEELYRMEEQYA